MPLLGGAIGGSWGADGNIILGGIDAGLLQVPASGGALAAVLEVASGDSQYIFLQVLPDGKAVLFENRTRDRNTDSIEVFSFASRQRKTVIRGGANPNYLLSGHLIYTSSGTLFAVAFDPGRLETAARPSRSWMMCLLPGQAALTWISPRTARSFTVVSGAPRNRGPFNG